MSEAEEKLVTTYKVEEGKVREFARAVQDTRAVAEGTAPVTFPICASAELVERLLRDRLRLDGRYTVHGEHELEYTRPLRPGDELLCSIRLVADYVKEGRRGGRMRFVVCETEMRDARTEELVVVERMTAIVTEPGEGR